MSLVPALSASGPFNRDQAVEIAQRNIVKRNKKLVEKVLEIQEKEGKDLNLNKPVSELPIIAVTVSTSWEGYGVVHQLVHDRKFRVRALYRTPGTTAAKKLETLQAKIEKESPGLLELCPEIDMSDSMALTKAFEDVSYVFIYLTANTSKAGKINNNGNNAPNGRRAVMSQALAIVKAVKANPTIDMLIQINFPTDKVYGYVPEARHPPWWVHQRLKMPDFFRSAGIDCTCIHRPAYYYAMHRVSYDDTEEMRGKTALSRTLISEKNVPGIMHPEYMVNWVDVRDVGKWVGTVAEYPDVFRNVHFSIASAAITGNQRVAKCEEINKHGTKFKYKRFTQNLMRFIGLFTSEVSYPLKYSLWYNDKNNAYDFSSDEDLADLDKINTRWTFEDKLISWHIPEIKPAGK